MRTSVNFRRTIFFGPAFLACLVCHAANPDKLSPDLLSDQQSASVSDVIVQYRQEPGAKEHARVGLLGGKFKAHLEHSRAAVYTMSGTAAANLSDDDNVL